MPVDVEILGLLQRCVAMETAAAQIYEVLARRFAADDELTVLWFTMAADEREHAHKLATWRELLAAEPPEHWPRPSGFEVDIAAVEALLTASRAAAPTVDEEEALALALALEGSEIDAIYTTLLQCSPLARYPDLCETVRHETAEHHHTLLEVVHRRGQTEKTLLRAALLAVREAKSFRKTAKSWVAIVAGMGARA